MIVDDERLIVEHIDRLLTDAGIEVLGGYTNPHEALQSARALQPDVLFLDIEMPELSGLEIAERLYADNSGIEIVFITAFNHYALDAFRVNALDYLLKPVHEEELSRSLERIRRRRHAYAAKDRTPVHRRLTAALYGKFNVYVDGEPIRWVTAKCAELFAYMLLQGDKDASKWQLFETLWNEKDSEKADINLRSTVSRINKTLRDLQAGIALVSVRNGYRLALSDEAPMMMDARQLERFVLDDAEIHADNADQVEQLVEHCSQPLLQEFGGEWCEPYRIQHRQYALQLGRRLLSYYSHAAAEPLKRLRLAEKLIGLEPYNDSLRAAALKLHHQLDGPQRTAAYYEAYAALLQTDLGTEPSDALTALYQSLLDAAHAEKQQPRT